MTTRGARKPSDLVPLEAIQHRILILRGAKVLLDNDLATVYGVSTKVVTNCAHLSPLKFSPNLPYAFAEHAALMVASNLLEPPKTEKLPIGFHVRDRRAPYHTTNTLV